MVSKKLKYLELLKEFPDCPSKDFEEINCHAYRWTKSPVNAADFIPLNISDDPPQRILDDTDKMCIGYGLSMFDTLENSFNRYKRLYNNHRELQRGHFKEDKGTHIAEVELNEINGIANKPNRMGHFTFHEYENTQLETQVISVTNIFKENGEFNIQ